MIKNILLTIIALTALAGCAVNRVEEVTSASDARSIYKVPVIYGIGIAENSLLIGPNDVMFRGFGFAEYDPATKKGTSSCLGTADQIWMGFPISWWYSKPVFDHKLHYHVLMVPPGYYALSGGGASISVHVPKEANPSLYFKIKSSIPQYLGDFWLIKSPGQLYSTASMNLANPELSTLPVEYHEDEVINTLQKFDISSKGLQRVPLLPTSGGAALLLCTP